MSDPPIRILVVEDDPDDYLILEKLFQSLKKRQYELERVSRSSAAIERILANAHDICLMDYRLEGRNGMELLREALGKGASLPIIFLTGQDGEDLDLEALQSGAADFLNKNDLNAGLLERSIRFALERRKAEDNRSRLAAIVESSNDAIFLVSLQGIILSWNPGASRIYVLGVFNFGTH